MPSYIPVLAVLLPPSLSTLSDTLSAIPTVSVGVVNVEYCGKGVLPAEFEQVCVYVCTYVCVSACVCVYMWPVSICLSILLQSFGYLVPSHQASNVLGVVNDSGTFPEHDRRDQPSTRLTVSSLIDTAPLVCIVCIQYFGYFLY